MCVEWNRMFYFLSGRDLGIDTNTGDHGPVSVTDTAAARTNADASATIESRPSNETCAERRNDTDTGTETSTETVTEN